MISAIGAYYKYGDRTEVFKNSLQGTNAVIEHMLRNISVSLADKLKTVFSADPRSVITSVLDQSGNPYSEIVANPTGGEEYRDAIFDFVENAPDILVDYRSLILARNSWCMWAKFLSWASFCLLFWQAMVVLCGAVGLINRIDIPDSAIRYTFYVTVVFAMLCIALLAPILSNHNTIIEVKRKYHVL